VPRRRLDVALVEEGLFESRSRAQAAVMAGQVSVGGVPATKPGTLVAHGATLAVSRGAEFVSRGGQKLANALDATGTDVSGASALDVGASTGGFTHCLLTRGARRVVALDVGYGQLDWRLRNDPRVTVLERTNARHFTPDALPYAPDLVVMDVSFISAALVWPAVARCLAPGWRGLVMVKPQFEVGREHVGSGGVVRDSGRRAEAVRAVADAVTVAGGAVADAVDSGVPGPKGNREVFVLCGDPAVLAAAPDIEARIAAAVAEGT
jgi:23S rRNA (cytidine1920-2'-O)/16S rRNA (cytidine1409-2'-O)-methyltransferase